jgi:hypothetical protein
MTFKLLSEQTAGSVSVFEQVVPIGAGTPLHIHRTSDEVIHLLPRGSVQNRPRRVTSKPAI